MRYLFGKKSSFFFYAMFIFPTMLAIEGCSSKGNQPGSAAGTSDPENKMDQTHQEGGQTSNQSERPGTVTSPTPAVPSGSKETQ